MLGSRINWLGATGHRTAHPTGDRDKWSHTKSECTGAIVTLTPHEVET